MRKSAGPLSRAGEHRPDKPGASVDTRKSRLLPGEGRPAAGAGDRLKRDTVPPNLARRPGPGADAARRGLVYAVPAPLYTRIHYCILVYMTTHEHEMMAWLGPAADDLTDEQVERIAEEARHIEYRYPDPDEQVEREAALSAVVQYLLGDMTPEDARLELTEARLWEQRAFTAACWVGVMLVRDRMRAGGSPDKSAAARAVGINRMSLLAALGER